MATDWQLIRDTLNATIDACEQVESLGLTPTERGDPEVPQAVGRYREASGVAPAGGVTRATALPSVRDRRAGLHGALPDGAVVLQWLPRRGWCGVALGGVGSGRAAGVTYLISLGTNG